MSREELKLALIGVLVESVDDGMIEATEEKILFDLTVADRLLSVLNPILERVAGGLHAIIQYDADPEGFGLADCIDNDGKAYQSEDLAGLLRQAASLHTELKGLLDG